MATPGFLIYSGVMPLIKMYLTTLFGFILSRKGLFPIAATKGVSQVTMNVSLPALIFASIVPAFSSSNASAIGPLALIAVIYIVIGFFFGIVLREVCYVPRNFWQGFVIAAALSNWGNLPNAVVLSIMQQSPFNPSTDPNLGVSYVSIFIVVYHLFFWAGGAAHSLSWDYLPGVPQGEEAERRVPWKEKPLGSFITRLLQDHKLHKRGTQVVDNERRDGNITDVNGISAVEMELIEPPHGETANQNLSRQISHVSATFIQSGYPSTKGSILPIQQVRDPPVSSSTPQQMTIQFLPPLSFQSFISPRLCRFFQAISVVVTPITLTIAISLPIALVHTLKILFVNSSTSTGSSWKGPDGRPPLAFIIDTAGFIGGMTIPLSLILLGASFGRMRIPRPISRLPIPAILAMCAAKMVALPAIGIFIVQAMAKDGFVDKNSKPELFVAMFLSGTPAAVNQMIVSSLYCTNGDLDTLSAFLLAQYIFMFFASSTLTVVSLMLI